MKDRCQDSLEDETSMKDLTIDSKNTSTGLFLSAWENMEMEGGQKNGNNNRNWLTALYTFTHVQYFHKHLKLGEALVQLNCSHLCSLIGMRCKIWRFLSLVLLKKRAFIYYYF